MRARGLGGLAAIVAIAGSYLVVGTASTPPAGAQTATKTYPAVSCTATIGTSKFSQSQDITVEIVAPDQVSAGSHFTVTIPGGTNVLPSSSNGFTITSYRDLSLSYQIHGSTFVNGTVQNPGTAYINGDPTPNTAAIGPADVFTIGQPGPFPPGTLVTPDVSVDAVAGAAGTSITMNALKLTTTARLNNSVDAQVTCNIPQDTIITIPVVSASPPPVVDAGPDGSGDVGSPIALHGTVTSSGATPTLTWSAATAPCRFADLHAADTTVTCTQPGTFTVTLTADDGLNPPVRDTARVTVVQPSMLVVDAGPSVSGTVSHTIALDGLVSDPGHTPTSHWTITSPSCTFANANAPSTTVNCSDLGTFTATLSATDGGPVVSDTTTVTVHEDLAPVTDAGPDVSGDTGAAIALRGAAPDAENDPVTAHWTTSDPHCTIADASALVTTITCSVEGDYSATLSAKDAFHPATTDTAAVKVRDVRFPFDYVVDATTHLKKANQDVTIPTGTFKGVIDLTTGTLGGDLTLPPAQTTLNLAGIGLVTANMQIVQRQPVTGTLNPVNFAVTSTAVFDIHIVSVYPTATPTVNIVGDSCTTSSPVSVTMSGTANLTGASTFSSTYTIPDLQTCGLATTALNLLIPGPGNTFTAVVQPPPSAPTVTTDPSSRTVAAGSNYSFSAAASGYPPPAQQWQVSTDHGATFTDIPGATGPTYGASGARSDSGKQFRARFTNASGTATSAAATLTVAVPPSPPVIGTATAARASAVVTFSPGADDGGSPVIDSTATCTSSGGGTSGSATATSSPITVTGLTAGAPYTCSVTARNVIGSSAPSGASNTVVPTSVPAVTQQPQDVTVQAGQPYSFTAAASGTPTPTVQWQVSRDGGASYTDVPGATSPTLTATAAYSDSGDQFRAVFTNAEGTATSDAAILTVTGIAPQVTRQPASVTVEAGTSYSFSAGASGSPTPTQQWQQSTDNGATFHDIPGATSDPLTGSASTSQSGTRFRSVFTNSGGSTTTDAAVLTVVPPYALSIGSAAVVEGDSGPTRPVSLPVVLSKPAGGTVTVHYSTFNGTATAPTDYTAKTNGMLTFAAGTTVQYVNVLVKADTVVEGNETLTVRLNTPTGGAELAPGRSTGTVTILNDDAGSGLRVDVGDVSISEGNAAKSANNAKVLVTLSAPATSTVTVRVTLTTGTPATGFKTWAPKTVTFSANQYQHVLMIGVVPDTVHGADKHATLTLSNASSGVTIGRSVGSVTVLEDD